jgi:hypothetical protein
MYTPYVHHPLRHAISWLSLFLVLISAAGCSHTSTSSRIRRLTDKEAALRSSVDTLEARQRELRAEIQRAESQAALARCQASQASYRAAVAAVFSDYSAAVAEHKGCQASAAKEGGAVMAVGCGLATFLTGGWALAVCGGSLLAGAVVSDGCSGAPPPMTTTDIHRIAREKTGLSGPPHCGTQVTTASPRRAYDPYGNRTRVGDDGSVRKREQSLFHVPTRKELRRDRVDQRKQARLSRKLRERAERRAAKARRRR